jgi:putative transport protein
LPVLIAYFMGSKFLKMKPAILLGSITGSMTSRPSLNVVSEAAKSETPDLVYAGTYSFAYVLPILAGTIMMRG